MPKPAIVCGLPLRALSGAPCERHYAGTCTSASRLGKGVTNVTDEGDDFPAIGLPCARGRPLCCNANGPMTRIVQARTRQFATSTLVAVGLAVGLCVLPAPVAAQVRVDLGRHTRLQRFARDAAYGTAEGLGFAAIDQAQDRPSEWGGGAAGYGKRAASNVGGFLIQESVTEGLAAALKHPLDYTRCRCGGILPRTGHALLGAVADEEPGGAYTFALPRFAGAYAGALAQTTWRPGAGRSRVDTALRNGSTSLAIGGLINLFHVFIK